MQTRKKSFTRLVTLIWKCFVSMVFSIIMLLSCKESSSTSSNNEKNAKETVAKESKFESELKQIIQSHSKKPETYQLISINEDSSITCWDKAYKLSALYHSFYEDSKKLGDIYGNELRTKYLSQSDSCLKVCDRLTKEKRLGDIYARYYTYNFTVDNINHKLPVQTDSTNIIVLIEGLPPGLFKKSF